MRKILIGFIIVCTTLSVNAQVNTDRVMNIGKNALYFEDYVVAIQYFNQVIAAKPYLADPYYYRAMAKFLLDDFKGAEEDCTACLERNPYYTAAYQLRGAALQNQNKYELAAADYKKSLEFFPEDRLTLVNMGIVNVELKQYDIAEKFFDVLLRRFPDYSPGYLTRGQMYLEQKDTAKALVDYNKAIEIDPYTAQSFSARGLVYVQQSRFDKALTDLNEAIRLDPFFDGNYINRGLVKYNLNDLRGAMADYDKVIDMDKNNLIARFNRGLLRAQVGDNNRAIEDFNEVVKQEPTNYIAFLNRALLKNEIGDKTGALADLNVVLKQYPDYFTGYYMRSQIKRELNDLRGAEQDYLLARSEETKARKKATVNPSAKDTTSKKTEQKDTREETDKDIEKFNLLVVSEKESPEKNKYQRESRGKVQNRNARVEMEPLFILTYYEKEFDVRRPVYYSAAIDKANREADLSWILKATNKEAPLNEIQVEAHFRSIDTYSRRIQVAPEKPMLYFGRALDFILVQDYENAFKDINQVISLKPEFTLAYFLRAVIRSKQLEIDPVKNNDATLAEAPLSIVQPPLKNNHISAATISLPEMPIRKMEYDAVLKDYEMAIKLDSSFSFAYYNRAEIYSLEKNYKAAIEDYNRAIKEQPQFAEAYFNRGIARLSIGETAQGLDDLRKAGELGIVESYSIIKRMQ